MLLDGKIAGELVLGMTCFIALSAFVKSSILDLDLVAYLPETVSYTHLLLPYRFIMETCTVEGLMMTRGISRLVSQLFENTFVKVAICQSISPLSSKAVSYTHLDVYKRQEQGYFSAEKLVTKKIKLENIVEEGFIELTQDKSQIKILVQPE